MHASLALALTAASFATARNVVSLDIHKPQQSAQDRRARRLARRATINEPLVNGQNLYYANVSVGTPPQPLSLQIDTGSSDVWMTSSSADFCQNPYNADECSGGVFNEQTSTTFNVVSTDFSIMYVDETGSTGDFFTDSLSIGPSGSAVTVTDQQMGLALDTTIGTGIIGVGFAADESVCSQSSDYFSSGPCDTYPSIMQTLVSQKKINSQAYSLWLNDLDANTGSILFGGIDTAKYTGQLISLPIQPDADSGSITSFTIAWTNLTLGSSDGVAKTFVPSNFAEPAILDSGTTLTLMPDEIATSVLAEFSAEEDTESGIYLAACSLASSTATFDFQFGGASGPIIRVPINEFLLPTASDGYQGLTLTNGQDACEVGIMPAGSNPTLFGDTFLRSAYVVYDLDNQEISLAQTDFNASSSNIQEIQAGKQGIPDVSMTLSGAMVTQSATAVDGYGLGGGYQSTRPASVTLTIATGGAAPLAQFTAANSNNPQPAAGSSTAGAPGMRSLRATSILHGEGLILGSLLAAAAAVGGALVML